MNVQLGQMHDHSFRTDPKHLGFVLRRYHFVARMLRGCKNVLEVGCGDQTGAPIVQAAVGKYVGIDSALGYGDDYSVHDMLHGPFGSEFDGVFALDVLEHVERGLEDIFFHHVNLSLAEHGRVIIGAPSLESQPYASELSRRYHVNCKTGAEFLDTLQRHYHNVFLLGLNDYALHDGYDPMVHYRLALCTGKK